MESLGQYKLLQRIAIGGMAEIFLAEKPGPAGFSRKLAIKRILPHRADDSEFVEMFLNEARLAAMLNHPNIVQIYDLGEVDGTYYLAMEYVDGYDLGQILDKSDEINQPIPPAYIARLISQAAIGLYHAHNYCDPQTRQPLNLVHRDISLPNIMVSRDGIVKLLDFGIAKASSTQSQRDPTQAGVLKGKISYMSPEYLRGERIDGRHDLFALGVVMYELATGQKPFQAKGDVQMLQAILTQPPRDPYAFNPSLPHTLVDIMMRLLTKEPQARIQSGAEVQSALESFIYQSGQQDITQAQIASYLQSLFLGAPRPVHESLSGLHQAPPQRQPAPVSPRHTPAPRPSGGSAPGSVHAPQPTSILTQNASGTGAFQPMSGRGQTPNWMVEETRALSLDQLSLAGGQPHKPQLTSALPGLNHLDTPPPTLDASYAMGHIQQSANLSPNTPIPPSLRPTAPTPVIPDPSEQLAIPPMSAPALGLPNTPSETGSSRWLLGIIVLCFLLGGGGAFGFWYAKKRTSPEQTKPTPDERTTERRPEDRNTTKNMPQDRQIGAIRTQPTPSIPPQPRVPERQPERIQPTPQPSVQPTPNRTPPEVRTTPEDRSTGSVVKYIKPAGIQTSPQPQIPDRTTSSGTNVRKVARVQTPEQRLEPLPPVRPRESDPTQAVGIQLSSKPRCVVYWRGQMLGLTPRFLPLPPGKHMLMLRRSSPSVRYLLDVTVNQGEILRKHVDIPESLLIVHSPQTAKLYIDGHYYGLITRQRFIRVYAGYHKVVATSAGQTIRKDINLRGGGRFNLKLNFGSE